MSDKQLNDRKISIVPSDRSVRIIEDDQDVIDDRKLASIFGAPDDVEVTLLPEPAHVAVFQEQRIHG